MKNLKKKKGFTIVELVIVIAVIGVLSAILIPTFSSLISEARAKRTQLELRNSYEAYAVAAVEDAAQETEVYLYNASTVTPGNDVKVWHYEAGENGEYSWVEVASTGYTYTCVSLDDSSDPVAYNGYYVFTRATA